MHWLKRTVLLCCSLLLCAAVQAAEGAPDSAATVSAQLRNFQQIVSSGELRVGVALFSPWTMVAKNGDLIGSEIDMATRLAKDMGLKLRTQVYDWNNLIPALNKGEIDIIAAGMAVTPQRALQVNFSEPYAESGVGIAANTARTSGFKSLDEMNRPDVTLAIVAGTISGDVAQAMFSAATFKTFDSEAQAVDSLLKGESFAYIASDPIPKYLALDYPSKIDVPLAKPLIATREAFAVRKGDADLVNYLNAWIVAHQADAWISSTRRYWFDSVNWRQEVGKP